jgi:endonuclease/exonuclease/phosphatase family metal-dependent hydrolase
MNRKLRPRIMSALKRERVVYAHRHHRHGDEDGHLTIGSYNVHKCVGTDGRFDPARIAEVIAEMDVDVVALQEACKRFGRREALVDFDDIEKRTGLAPLPLSHRGGPGWHGNMILAREGSFREIRRLRLPGAEPRGAVVVDMEFEAGPLRIVAAHLGLLRQSRLQQVRTIMRNAMARGEEAAVPALIMGDLNEWRVGSRSSLSGLHPTFAPVEAVLPSFPAQFPVLPLDRVLGAPHDLVRKIEVHDTPLSRLASDHLPLRAHVDLPAGLNALQLREAQDADPER